jgi:type IV fimbrial biogenesis protein FimT
VHIKRMSVCSDRGFSLPELVVVLALLALMAVFTAPSFYRWLLRDQVDQAARSLLATFSYARGEALRLGRRVNVCRADGTAHCAKPSLRCGSGIHAGTDNWACGWLVTTDAGSGSDDAPSRQAGQMRVLRRYPAHVALFISSPAAMLSFTPPAGQVIANFRSFEVAAAVSLVADQAQLTRCIRLAIGGRARISDGVCKAAS